MCDWFSLTLSAARDRCLCQGKAISLRSYSTRQTGWIPRPKDRRRYCPVTSLQPHHVTNFQPIRGQPEQIRPISAQHWLLNELTQLTRLVINNGSPCPITGSLHDSGRISAMINVEYTSGFLMQCTEIVQKPIHLNTWTSIVKNRNPF